MTKLLLAMLCVANVAQAQIWEARNIDYPVPTQGWKITPVGDNIAFTYGFGISNSEEYGWTNSDFMFASTTDGGNNWHQNSFPHTEPGFLSNIAAINDQRAWISYVSFVDGNHILQTDDAGQNWTELNVPITTWVNFVHFFDNEKGVAVGDPDELGFMVFATADGGTTWERIGIEDTNTSLFSEYGMSGEFSVSGSSIWFPTTLGRVFYSDDIGDHWQIFDAPTTPVNGSVFGLAADAHGTAYLAYNDWSGAEPTYQIFRRSITDIDWNNITPLGGENNFAINGMAIVPESEMLVLNLFSGWDGIFETKITQDEGEKWVKISTGAHERTGYCVFTSPENGYSCQLPESYDEPTTKVYRYRGDALTVSDHTWFINEDDDGYGAKEAISNPRPVNGFDITELAPGSNGTDDCDDTNPVIFPTAVEFCNYIDDDCDNQIDESGAICIAPIGLKVTDITSTAAQIKWNQTPCATKYRTLYRVAGTTTWNYKTVTSLSRNLTNLQPNTNYLWRVRNICTENISTLSAVSRFKTLPVTALIGITNGNNSDEIMPEATVVLSPNPTHNYLNINVQNLTDAHDAATIALIDISGSIALSWNATAQNGHLNERADLSNLPNGIYTLSILHGDQKISKSIIKM